MRSADLLIRFGVLACTFAAIAAPVCAAKHQTYGFSVVDPLYKMTPEADLNSVPGGYVPEVARGEYATWLVLLRNQNEVDNLSAQASAPTGNGGSLPVPRIRYVAMVSFSPDTEKRPSHEALRPPSNKFPDPLLPTVASKIPGNHLIQIWVDVKIPYDAAPGSYQTSLTVQGGNFSQQVPLSVTVDPVTVGRPHFLLSQSFYPGIGLSASPVSPAPEIAAYMKRLRVYADNLASHGERVLRLNPLSWTAVRPDGSYDFSVFDQYVQVFRDAGCGDKIQAGFLGARSGAAWVSPFAATIGVPSATGLLTIKKVPADSDEARNFFSSYLPALVNHLKEKGWLSDFLQNIADEPIPENLASWRILKGYADQYEPGVTTVEAEPSGLIGVDLVDINCPILESLANNWSKWEPIVHAPGRTFWFYVANSTKGEFANRFIDQPALMTRVIPWIGFSCGASGFLHWGYNSWYTTTKDPLTDVTPSPDIPPGDGWIVYRGPNGPIDSIRWEQTRDGMDDYEVLRLAGLKDVDKTHQLLREVVHSLSEYDMDVPNFRRVRHQLLALAAS